MSEACQPSLRYGGSTTSPGVPAGTTIAEISPCPVRAVTVTSDVIGVPELVMKALTPSITHSSAPSSRAAFVRVAPASLPPSGSVRPKAPRARPATRSGSQRWRCSSVPNEKIGLAPRPTPADSVMPSDWSTRPISSMAMHSVENGAVRAAVGLGEHQPEQAELAHGPHGVEGEGVVPVPGLGVRCHLGVGEGAHDRPERLLLVVELEVHAQSP